MPKRRAGRGVVGSWLSGYDSGKGSKRETGLDFEAVGGYNKMRRKEDGI